MEGASGRLLHLPRVETHSGGVSRLLQTSEDQKDFEGLIPFLLQGSHHPCVG